MGPGSVGSQAQPVRLQYAMASKSDAQAVWPSDDPVPWAGQARVIVATGPSTSVTLQVVQSCVQL